MNPQPGDRYTKDGVTLTVTFVSEAIVTFDGHTIPRDQFLQLAEAALRNGATYHPAMTPTPALTGSDNTHARLGPSSSKRWSTCTGSVAYLEANAHRLPKDTGSSYASEGTEAHEWAAKLLLGQITLAQVPEDFREHVNLYVEHCKSLVPEGVVPQVETVVNLYYQPTEPGTCDFAAITDERITVRDLKYGMGVLVGSDENTQLAIYAYSLIKMVDDVFEFTDDTLVDIGVVQPRHREAHLSEPWITTLANLRTFCEDIAYRATQATVGLERCRAKGLITGNDVSAKQILEAAPGLKFVPQEGDDGACRWCPAKGICEVRIAAATECLAFADDTPATDLLAMMPDLTKGEKKLPVEERVTTRFERMGVPSEVLTDDYFVRIFAAKKWIESCLADVEEMLESRALGGEQIPGTKLVMGRAGNRAWRDEEAADAFLRGQRLKEAERYDFKLKSPTKIEELLKDKLAKVTRTKNLFEALIVRSEPKKVLALASDKREAVAATLDMMPDVDTIDDYEV